MIRTRKYNKGFTLIELLVCMIIFVIMTALLVVKYGNFSQNILVTNIAYDTALAIRTAQNYGLSVKTSAVVGSLDCSSGSVGDEGKFQCSYGVEFDTSSSPKSFKTFVHKPLPIENGQYNSLNSDLPMTTYNLRSNASISGYCFTDTGCATDATGKLDILFRRPDPAAMIYFGGDTNPTPRSYVKITIQGSDGTKRYISIRSNGQISVDI